ncbi:MAG: hypothetical protein QNJ11_17095 [Woeseiaceae bacterium]|nr:hypothetical protein [Woeseiaceae bacterium]
MLKHTLSAALTVSLPVAFLGSSPILADEHDGADDEITEITVSARRVANTRPAGTYVSPATALRFDPLTELQSRGIAEGQSDVTVRGGVFENTGFKVGAVTVMDPQTGHYVAELPIDPAALATPAIYKGIDNAVEGFNSAIATVTYGIRRIESGGNANLGFGTDNLNFQAIRYGRAPEDGIGFQVSAARSDGDGTVEFGDHEFTRVNAQLQWEGDGVQSDVIASYQDKFYGWPGAYTGFASLPETDDTQTTFLLFNQRRESADGWFEYGGFYRRLEDDYDFNRTDFETGAPGSFEHETRVMAIGFQGSQRTGRISWRYGGQVTSDELVRSTDLTNGSFDDRSYATLTIVPSVDVALDSGSVLVWRFGATVDYSNRDSNEVSPMLGVSLERTDPSGTTSLSLEYAQTTQLPGYTALNSNPSGLFGGNASLGRETARQLSASIARDTGQWQARATVFGREDDDLVDWTYSTGAPFARQANAVDVDVIGVEMFITHQWADLDIAAGYTWLDKDADYGSAQVDASFYALNFARHRATLALRYRFAAGFEVRLDNEYRRQEENPLRVGDDQTYLASMSFVWSGNSARGLSIALVADNLTDSEFQPFPGTPAAGRQVSLNAGYAW